MGEHGMRGANCQQQRSTSDYMSTEQSVTEAHSRRDTRRRQPIAIVALGWPLLFLLAALSTTAFVQPAAAATCPAGYRALTFTNNCGYDVYLGEGLSQPQVDGTPVCTQDSDCTNGTTNPNLKCVADTSDATTGACTITCSKDSDCGPNQVCFSGNVPPSANAWYDVNSTNPVGECWFANLEPTPLSAPAPSSNWDLPANGGQSVICVPEAQEASGKSAEGASCTQPSDCASDNCYDAIAGYECIAGDTNCTCGSLFTWGGNFWGRTGCSPTSGGLTCQTGDCGGAGNGLSGLLDCSGNTANTPHGPANPAYAGEFTLEVPPSGTSNVGAQDYYDTSMVNGFNVGFSMVPVSGTYSPAFSVSSPKQCGPAGETVDQSGTVTACPFNLLSSCPSSLTYNSPSGTQSVVGCWAPTQACLSGTTTQQAALGCTGNVPFLCATTLDCPYGHQATPEGTPTPERTLTCNISPSQAFGQCQCMQDTDCPKGFTCEGSPRVPARMRKARPQRGPISMGAIISTTFRRTMPWTTNRG